MSLRRFLSLSLIAACLPPLFVFELLFRLILVGHAREDVRLLPQNMFRAVSAQEGPGLLDRPCPSWCRASTGSGRSSTPWQNR